MMKISTKLQESRDQTVTDPYWEKVIAYYRGDTGNSNDLSPNAQAPGQIGSALLTSTGQFKFGTGAIYKPAGANYINGLGNGTYAIGTDDYTIECWLYVVGFTDATNAAHNYPIWSGNTFQNGVSGGPTIPLLMTYISGGTSGSPNTGGTWAMSFYENTALGNPQHSRQWTTGSWNHFSCCRQGTTIYMSVNGTVQNLGTSSKDWSTTNIPTGSTGPKIGQDGYNEYNVTYYLDEFRFTRGVARYTSNFPVPTKQFPTPTLP